MVKVNTTVVLFVGGAERQLKKIYGSKENRLHMLVCKYSKINATRDPYIPVTVQRCIVVDKARSIPMANHSLASHGPYLTLFVRGVREPD